MSNLIKVIYLENIDELNNHHKFYEITTTPDNQVITRWGRIGTKGRTQVRTFASKWAASETRTQILRNKLTKGYVIVRESLGDSQFYATYETEQEIIKQNQQKEQKKTPNSIEIWTADF
jgi:predicted DNA-binding WGR domain protein